MTVRVNNPLTIIAIFATLAEGFATISLINLPAEIQAIFVYFVMLFPVLIVVAFFVTLIWRHYVLYAPSDFENEEMYLESLRIQEAVKAEVVGSLTSSAILGEITLSPEQIHSVANRVTGAIGKASTDLEKEKILSLLVEGGKSVLEICNDAMLSRAHAFKLLSELHSEGKITQRREGAKSLWYLAK